MLEKLLKGRGIAYLARHRHCPLCGWCGSRFLAYGSGQRSRSDAICPSCGSLERHRAAYVLLKEELAGSHLALHVAPEPAISKWLISFSGNYVSIDLTQPAVVKMDLTALGLANASRSLVWCSHVLEHICEDRRAMAEMYRVLQPGGMAVVQVPIWRETTHEDCSIGSPEGRLRAFLQENHVRLYGLDIIDRLESVGFDVQVKRVTQLPPEVIRRQSLYFTSTNEVFLCRKI